MILIQKRVKKKFNSQSIQVSAEAMNMIDDHVNRIVDRMVQRTKEGRVKRLTPELMWVPLGNYNNK